AVLGRGAEGHGVSAVVVGRELDRHAGPRGEGGAVLGDAPDKREAGGAIGSARVAGRRSERDGRTLRIFAQDATDRGSGWGVAERQRGRSLYGWIHAVRDLDSDFECRRSIVDTQGL